MSSRYSPLNNYDWLYEKYWAEGKSTYKIADIVGCSSHVTVFRALRRLSIPTRSSSEVTKGKNNPNYGKHWSEKTKQKVSDALKGKRTGKEAYWYGKHHSEETKQKLRKARRKQKFPKNHTTIECIYWKISKKNNIPSVFVGDGSLWIGRLNPDFVIRNKKIAIFINGDYWHSPLLRYNIRDTQQVDFQIAECKKRKWKAIILWEADLRRKDADAFVLFVLKKEKVIR